MTSLEGSVKGFLSKNYFAYGREEIGQWVDRYIRELEEASEHLGKDEAYARAKSVASGYGKNGELYLDEWEAGHDAGLNKMLKCLKGEETET